MDNRANNTYIKVEKLSKNLASKNLVNNITFGVEKGVILGLLGPNGAGKSTTMRMLVGCIQATSGSIDICGHQMGIDAQEAKSYIGYLPEHNLLYLEMYVLEYLQFMARARGINQKSAIKRALNAVDKCGLNTVKNQKIYTLSKGYRQRVGLAQAIIHDPDVLVLDEPTTGLDPSQILEIRHLIKDLSVNKAVVLSTHIMQEVEALCSDVLILDHGELKLHRRLSDIKRQNKCQIIVEFKQCIDREKVDLSKIDFITNMAKLSDTKFALEASNDLIARERIFLFAKENGYTILELKSVGNTMEDIFKEAIRRG